MKHFNEDQHFISIRRIEGFSEALKIGCIMAGKYNLKNGIVSVTNHEVLIEMIENYPLNFSLNELRKAFPNTIIACFCISDGERVWYAVQNS